MGDRLAKAPLLNLRIDLPSDQVPSGQITSGQALFSLALKSLTLYFIFYKVLFRPSSVSLLTNMQLIAFAMIPITGQNWISCLATQETGECPRVIQKVSNQHTWLEIIIGVLMDSLVNSSLILNARLFMNHPQVLKYKNISFYGPFLMETGIKLIRQASRRAPTRKLARQKNLIGNRVQLPIKIAVFLHR